MSRLRERASRWKQVAYRLEMETAPIAAHCSRCNSAFVAEPRELFLGELYCPCCTARTETSSRALTLEQILKAHPQAHLYATPKRHALAV